jgi:hypothetical protein
VIFQHSKGGREDRKPPAWHALPFWLVLMIFESALWLLLAFKFRQPCAPVALAAGLTLGLAVPMAGVRGLAGSAIAVLLAAATSALVLYAQAAFHASRVLGLPPLDALTGTGADFALAILDGLLTPVDLWFIGGGLLLAAVFGFGFSAVRRRAASAP